jgi:L-ascorbate metabolism protein UlaG (beta-lactamase superfamily)
VDETGTLVWIGTATVLLRLGPFTVLTDPSFLHRGQRAYLGKGLWSRRLTDPALRLEDLPPLDLVVLSHLHGDHFDRVARRGLDPDVPLVTTPAAARALRRWGFRSTVGLRTWESHTAERGGHRLTVTAAPGTHHTGIGRALLPPVMGSVLQVEEAGGRTWRAYVTGDTVVHDDLHEVPRRFPDLDLGLWHLGGTRVLGMTVTMDDRQGADLLEVVRPRQTVPVHHGDFGVFRSPVEDFVAECARRGLTGVRPVARGEVVGF